MKSGSVADKFEALLPALSCRGFRLISRPRGRRAGDCLQRLADSFSKSNAYMLARNTGAGVDKRGPEAGQGRIRRDLDMRCTLALAGRRATAEGHSTMPLAYEDD